MFHCSLIGFFKYFDCLKTLTNIILLIRECSIKCVSEIFSLLIRLFDYDPEITDRGRPFLKVGSRCY